MELDKLDPTQLNSLAKDLKSYPAFERIIRDDASLIPAYSKLFANRSLRVDGDYLRDISRQLQINPKGRPVVEIRRKAVNKTNYDVPIVTKVFKLKHLDIKGVYPDFSKYTVFSTKLRAEQYFLRDRHQFHIAKKELVRHCIKNKKQVEKKLSVINGNMIYTHPAIGEVSGKKLVDLQIKEIMDPTKTNIIGLTWHHNESYGVLDLMSYEVHKRITHTGGRAIWGGGGGYR